MPHFVIPLLGHGTVGGFLDQGGVDTGSTGLFGDRTVTGTATSDATLSDSFQSAKTILDNILAGIGLPLTQRQQTTDTNLINLGFASLDISKALNEQVTIRENQLARTQESIRNNQILQTNVNESFTKTLGDISKSLSDIGKGGFDPIKFFTDNPLIGGIGIGGLLVGGVVLLVVLK